MFWWPLLTSVKCETCPGAIQTPYAEPDAKHLRLACWIRTATPISLREKDIPKRPVRTPPGNIAPLSRKSPHTPPIHTLICVSPTRSQSPNIIQKITASMSRQSSSDHLRLAFHMGIMGIQIPTRSPPECLRKDDWKVSCLVTLSPDPKLHNVQCRTWGILRYHIDEDFFYVPKGDWTFIEASALQVLHNPASR